jgi:N-methylhydantoinase A
VKCPVYQRDQLSPGTTVDGPALIQELGSTTVLYPGDVCKVVATGEFVVTLGA